MAPPLVVGLVQVGEVVWERRPSHHFHLVDGALRLKPLPPANAAASLAYLPHSVALLQAYAEKYAPGDLALSFLPILYNAEPTAKAADCLITADLVGFSTYVWNIRYSLSLAAELKRRRRDIIIVMGGPHIPDEAEAFLRQNPCVDVVCHGEGEQTFLELLTRARTRDWHGIASTSFLAVGGALAAHPRRPRMKDLDQVPSPMLDGTYARVMAESPEQKWLATWETNRGPLRMLLLRLGLCDGQQDCDLQHGAADCRDRLASPERDSPPFRLRRELRHPSARRRDCETAS